MGGPPARWLGVQLKTLHSKPQLSSLLSRDNSVAVVTWLKVGPRELVVRFPVGARELPLLQSLQTGSGFHQASYSMDSSITGSVPGDKAAWT